MNEAVTDDIRIEIDEQVWTAFESVSVTKSMQDLCGHFTFRTVKRGAILPFANGSHVRVLVGTPTIGFTPIITGYIDRITPKHNAKVHTIMVSGRDETEDILDSTLGGNLTFKGPISLISLTEKILNKLGITNIKVSVDENVSTLSKQDLQFNKGFVASAFTGERLFDFLSRYARKKQVLLTTDDNGDLIYTRTSNKVINTKLVYSLVGGFQSNILSAEGDFDNSKRFHKYVCYSQANTTSVDISKDLESGTVGIAYDDEIRSSRTYSFIGDSPFLGSSATDITQRSSSATTGSGNDAKNRAIWESNVRRAKSFYYNADVIGYRAYDDGFIWRPNLLVQVDDDDIQISSQLLINAVRYTKDLSGSITTLNLVSKDTFDLLQITGATARKKASERIEGRKFAGGK